jgi:hypothetical protein
MRAKCITVPEMVNVTLVLAGSLVKTSMFFFRPLPP